MNADWNVEKAHYAEFNVPTCGTIAVWKLCRERQPWWKSHDGLNLRCLDQCCCVSFHGTSSSQGWRKMVVQSKFDPWVYILVFAECDLYRFVWESLPTEAYLCWHQCFSVVGQATAKIRPRPAHGLLSNQRTWFQELGWGSFLTEARLCGHQCFSVVGQATAKIRPRPAHGLLSNEKTWYQELCRTTEAIVPMNDRWRKLNDTMHQYLPLRASMCQHCSLSAVQRKTALGGTVMMGLNWKCLDQCHGVRSHGTSSSQGWRKMVVQSKFDPWLYILVFAECDLCRFVWESLPTEACLCWHQCFSVVGQATAKIRPRPAHGLLSNEKTWYQELYRTTEAIVPMNDRWRKLNDTMHQYVPLRASMCQHVPTLQFVSCAEKDSLWWNSHDGPELKMLGSMPWCSFPWHKLLPRLVQKNCCINLIDEFTSWVLAEGSYCRFA